VINSKFRLLAGILALTALAPVADAQRARDFAGSWKGTLDMNVLYGIPEEHAARLSKPVEIELRLFNNGNAEVYFAAEEDEWVFTSQRVDQGKVTPVSASNAVLLARLPSARKWQNNFAFNMLKIDDETMIVSWSRLSTRDELEYDGLDSMGMAGVVELKNDD
jgi:hypothetical protein